MVDRDQASDGLTAAAPGGAPALDLDHSLAGPAASDSRRSGPRPGRWRSRPADGRSGSVAAPRGVGYRELQRAGPHEQLDVVSGQLPVVVCELADGRGGRAAQCRGPVGARLHPGGAQGVPRDLRALSVHGVHGKRCAHGGHARDQPHELHDRADGASLRCPLAHVQHPRRSQDPRCPGRLRERLHADGGAALGHPLHLALGGLERRRYALLGGQVHRRCRAVRDGLPHGRRRAVG